MVIANNAVGTSSTRWRLRLVGVGTSSTKLSTRWRLRLVGVGTSSTRLSTRLVRMLAFGDVQSYVSK